MVVFTNISENYTQGQFNSVGDYIETKLSIIKNLTPSNYLVVNFDSLANNTFLEMLIVMFTGTQENLLSRWV